MIPDNTVHQRTAWKILTELHLPAHPEYERLVRECTSTATNFLRGLGAPVTLQARLQEALTSAATDAIERQVQSQPGSLILIRLWMMESTMATLRAGKVENDTAPASVKVESGVRRSDPDPGWGFFIVERAAGGAGISLGSVRGCTTNSDGGDQGSSSHLPESPGQGSIDVYLYLEGEFERRVG